MLPHRLTVGPLSLFLCLSLTSSLGFIFQQRVNVANAKGPPTFATANILNSYWACSLYPITYLYDIPIYMLVYLLCMYLMLIPWMNTFLITITRLIFFSLSFVCHCCLKGLLYIPPLPMLRPVRVLMFWLPHPPTPTWWLKYINSIFCACNSTVRIMK